MAKELIDSARDVSIWRIPHPSGEDEAYFVEDPRRTPETWAFGSRGEALVKFVERVKNAETDPPVR